MEVIFDSMVAHAPDEIRADTEAVRDAMTKDRKPSGKASRIHSARLARASEPGSPPPARSRGDESYLNDHCPVNSSLAQSIIHESE